MQYRTGLPYYKYGPGDLFRPVKRANRYFLPISEIILIAVS